MNRFLGVVAIFILAIGARLALAKSIDGDGIDFDDPEVMLDEARARAALSAAVPTPTPFTSREVLSISASGNITINGRPVMVAVAGQSPAGIVPERCRHDFQRAPINATIVCMPDDLLFRRITGAVVP